jgi:catechol 2,3-dioxygenase-like lactoylglutathione lyase family enzyme
MIDHISLGVRDLAAGRAFYEVVLAPLGYHLLVERDETVGFGKRYPEIWLNHRPGQRPVPADTGHHVCLRARSIDEVDRFHAAALGAGGRDAGGPGPRQGAQVTYYGAFVLDLDGNKLEAMTVPPAAD